MAGRDGETGTTCGGGPSLTVKSVWGAKKQKGIYLPRPPRDREPLCCKLTLREGRRPVLHHGNGVFILELLGSARSQRGAPCRRTAEVSGTHLQTGRDGFFTALVDDRGAACGRTFLSYFPKTTCLFF